MKYGLNRIQGDLLRFGMTPGKLFHRLGCRDYPRVFSISIPKSGTHLLERVLCLHPVLYRRKLPTIMPHNYKAHGASMEDLLERTKPAQIIVSHWYWDDLLDETLETLRYKKLFMIRDPRDTLISEVRYVTKLPNHPMYKWYIDEPLEKQLERRLTGQCFGGGNSYAAEIIRYIGWMEHATVIRFEDLIDSEGRSSEVQRIYRDLEVELSREALDHILSHMVSSASPTFNKGTSGGWRSVFTDELKDVFKTCAGDLLVRLGYESDMDW